METFSSTVRLRVSQVISRPSTRTSQARPSDFEAGATSICVSSASALTVASSCTAMPRSKASQVIARYITPVSKKIYSKALASLKPMVDLPDAAGPSMAMMDGVWEVILFMVDGKNGFETVSLGRRFMRVGEQIIAHPENNCFVISWHLAKYQPADPARSSNLIPKRSLSPDKILPAIGRGQ